MIRIAESQTDLDAYAAVWSTVHPDSPISGAELRARLDARRTEVRRHFVASGDGGVVGIGFTGGSSVPGRTWVAVAVLPSHRRRGLGSSLLEQTLGHAREVGATHAVGSLAEDELPWAERRGFAEFEREVVLVLELSGDETEGEPPEGIRVAPLQSEHADEAFEIYTEGVADMPGGGAHVVSRERWDREVAEAPLVLLALDRERVVGYAELERRTDDVLSHGLTAVARSHRQRGIASALKRAQIAWAARNGIRQLTTDTDIANVATQRLNERHGYRPLPPLVVVTRTIG